MIEVGTRNREGYLHVWRLQTDGKWLLVRRDGPGRNKVRNFWAVEFDDTADLITYNEELESDG